MIDVFYNGMPCANLPGSNYYVTCEGTLICVTTKVPYKARSIYRVTRKGTRKYYSKEQLKKLYAKFLD